MASLDHDVVIIGSGFGGAVPATSCHSVSAAVGPRRVKPRPTTMPD